MKTLFVKEMCYLWNKVIECSVFGIYLLGVTLAFVAQESNKDRYSLHKIKQMKGLNNYTPYSTNEYVLNDAFHGGMWNMDLRIHLNAFLWHKRAFTCPLYFLLAGFSSFHAKNCIFSFHSWHVMWVLCTVRQTSVQSHTLGDISSTVEERAALLFTPQLQRCTGAWWSW